MDSLETLEREPLGGARRDIDQESRPAPAFVLLTVDVERSVPDPTEQEVAGRRRQVILGQAHRRAAVAAAPGLKEDERPVGGLEAMNHLEGRPRGCYSSPRGMSRLLHLLEEPQWLRVIADEQALGLRVVLEHHSVVLTADP